jgi:hypothetical protein
MSSPWNKQRRQTVMCMSVTDSSRTEHDKKRKQMAQAEAEAAASSDDDHGARKTRRVTENAATAPVNATSIEKEELFVSMIMKRRSKASPLLTIPETTTLLSTHWIWIS